MKPKVLQNDKQRCSVLDCSSKRSVKSHRYPKEESTCLAWMNSTCNPRILELKPSQICGSRYVICSVHFKPEDYLCGVRRKVKPGAILTLFLPERNENMSPQENSVKVIDAADDNGIPSSTINVSPRITEFSPITYKRSPGSKSCRKSSLRVQESHVPLLPCTPKRKSSKKELFPQKKRCAKKSEFENVLNVLPDVSEHQHVVDEAVPAKVQVTGAKRYKSRPSKRLVFKTVDLDDSTHQMYEHVLEAKRERDTYRTKSLRRLNVCSSYSGELIVFVPFATCFKFWIFFDIVRE